MLMIATKKAICNVTRRVCRFADHSALLCVAMFSCGVSIALLGDRACPSDVDAVYRQCVSKSSLTPLIPREIKLHRKE